jgi:hypothetical protein
MNQARADHEKKRDKQYFWSTYNNKYVHI